MRDMPSAFVGVGAVESVLPSLPLPPVGDAGLRGVGSARRRGKPPLPAAAVADEVPRRVVAEEEV